MYFRSFIFSTNIFFMRVYFLLVVLCISGSLLAQHQSFGLRVGDPTGLSYKKYLSNSAHAVEFGIGSASPEWNKSYYKNSFKDYDRYNNDEYRSHNIESTFYLQGRYLKHYPWHVEGIEGTIDWYWGIGIMMKVAKIEYRYQPSDSRGTRVDDITDFDLGPEIPVGMEYTFSDIPVTIFSEAGLVIELTDRPGTLQLKGAVGVRYNFFKKL
jgi:hypothetical protein